ncbi:MAG: JAB domain-containing protein [Chloroflexi bacterium]|nr:MAG: JAB domain-containing protein [Chloroflexota bacterium]
MKEAALEYQPLIRDMPSEERPRERLRDVGAERMSTPELLAILLRTGANGENVVRLAQRLTAKFDGLPGLGRASFADLCEHRGVGEAKAAQILAAIEVGRRVVSAQPDQRRTIRCSEDISEWLRPEMVDLEQEHLKVVLLNVRNQVVADRQVYVGNVHCAVVRVSEVFKDAVRENCSSLIVVHNHPSGDPSPSPDDVALTKQIVEAGRLLNIEVLDHVVIARAGYVSLKERGLGW